MLSGLKLHSCIRLCEGSITIISNRFGVLGNVIMMLANSWIRYGRGGTERRVTLASLAHSPSRPVPAATFERVAHYDSPRPSPRLPSRHPPLKPHFHVPPLTPPPSKSPSPPSTFRRLPTPVEPTPTKTDRPNQGSTK